MTALAISNVILWIVVLALLVVVLALTRQIGLLHERIAPAGALMINRGLAVGEQAPVLELLDLEGRALRVGAGLEDAGEVLVADDARQAVGRQEEAVSGQDVEDEPALEVEPVSDAVGQRQDRPGAVVQQPARVPEDHLPRLPLEQGLTELLLQPRDGPTQGRLGQPDLLGRLQP